MEGPVLHKDPPPEYLRFPDRRWFVPEFDNETIITDDERAFAAALSEATAPLVCEGVHDILIPAAYGDHGENALVAGLELVDHPEGRTYATSLLDFGVHFHGNKVHGGRLHNQIYYVECQPPGLALDATGSIESLAEQTAEWFASVLRRPIVLYIWLHNGSVYASRYFFADASETLIQMYNKELAPPGQYESLIAAAQVCGRGWVQTAGLPRPDVYRHIRGDMERAVLPPGAR